ncbi:DUF7933 domain-containing protein [Blastococcus sp. SYSU DS1021]
MTATAAVASSVLLGAPQPAQAQYDQHGLDQVVLNPGGGRQADGRDGLRIVLNSSEPANTASNYMSAGDASDQLWFADTVQFCCAGAGPHLNVGGTLFGENAAAPNGGGWSSLTLVGSSGTTVSGTTLPSTTGDAAAHLRYTAEKNGLTYTIDRKVSYTFPNDYYRDSYTFTIPAGNTEEVKFYSGGDTSPGSDDQGYGIELTTPVRSVISLNPSSGIQVGQREVAGSKPFDGATSQRYNLPYPVAQAGGDIGFVVTTASHDAGFMTQWNLGATPGTQTHVQETFVNFQGASLTAAFRSGTAAAGTPVLLDLNVINTKLSEVTGIGYTFTLPEGLRLAPGERSNGCGGTLTAEGSRITLAGAAVPLASNCVTSVPVVATYGGSYSIGASSVSGLAVATNGVGTSTLTVSGPSAPPPPMAPGAPTGLTAAPSASSVLVSWRPPTTGGPVARYRVTSSPGSASCVTTGLSCLLGGVAGTTYTYTVTPLGPGDLAGTPASITTSVAVAAPQIPATPPETDLVLTTDRGLITAAAPGEEIVVIGTGFLPFSTVTIVIHSTPTVLGEVTTDENGDFTKAVVVPTSLAAGVHSLVAYGVDPDGNPHSLRMDVTVAAAAEPAALALTGQNVHPAVHLGASGVLLLAGAGLMLAARSRRARTAGVRA